MGSNNNLINAANAPSSAAAVAAPAMLSAGFIRAIQAGTYNNDPRFAMPVLQLLSLKKSAGGTAAQPDRWRLTVSDGDFFSVAMLATQLNALADQLNKGALIRLTHFVCNDINGKK